MLLLSRTGGEVQSLGWDKAAMRSRGRTLVYFSAALISVLLMGFIAFAASATRRPVAATPKADGIVVLTGGHERRIEAGVRLLKAGNGRRLLISGVNRKTKPEQLPALTDAGGACCVDLGYEAQDTVGNAQEARNWSALHGFKRLIVVTSSYHMPRSLMELSIAMPDVDLLAHPVMPQAFHQGAWWLRAQAARILLTEYLKLIESYARFTAHKIFTTSDAKHLPRAGTRQAASSGN